MAYRSGTVEVGEDATPVCPVPPGGARLRNLGGSTVYVGDAGVQADGDSAGYPVEAGASADFPGVSLKESTLVPAPAGDMQPPQLYARTAPGTGISKIAYITF